MIGSGIAGVVRQQFARGPRSESEAVILTISNEYGCGAVAIARATAAELGYAVIDRELPTVVAKRLNVLPDDIEGREDREPSLVERMLSTLESATPEAGISVEPRFDETLFRGVQAAVREFAARGNVVLIGRGAGLVLAGRSDVLRVFVHAPREWRVARVARESGASEKLAASEVDRIDRARRAYVRDWYAAHFGDPALYDLSLNAATLGEHGCIAAIVAGVRAR